MSKGDVYKLLVSKMNEVAVVPPQEIGSLTPIYKKIVPQLKFYPWKVTLIISSLIAFLLYMIFGATLVKLASLLQYGF
ncbi:hypothetical protein AUJ73_04745 [Candidatus Gottesmanbacteria bacterium CG1_02_37_22]|uniref:Preprotein translocase subunit SecE n=1 Tax=Candidatus Gottesmanbacteria bacterium CG1_02_37_22 TaxID=1805209 RepID=A0A1J4TL82_9BACT|nr:MAG: hypothetical protein AUJ73_04745 [Candidatus Gottesmanbacteria bacterium CG1_02_37_22]